MEEVRYNRIKKPSPSEKVKKRWECFYVQPAMVNNKVIEVFETCNKSGMYL